MLSMKGEEPPVKPSALLFQNANGDTDTCLAQLLYATSLHLGEIILTPHHHAAHSFLDDKVGAGRRLAVVGTGFQANVHRGLREQVLVLWPNGSEGIHLGMTLPTTYMIALTDDAGLPLPPGNYYHRPYHGVRPCSVAAVLCQLKATAHELLVCIHFSSGQLLNHHGCSIFSPLMVTFFNWRFTTGFTEKAFTLALSVTSMFS